MSANITELTDITFEEAITKSPTPILVDFWAPWCGPCRALAPVLEELSGTLAGRMAFAKMNVDENQDNAGRLKVRSIPCLIVFKEGQEIGRIIGHKGKTELTSELENLL
jgi:thioredoxin 1